MDEEKFQALLRDLRNPNIGVAESEAALREYVAQAWEEGWQHYRTNYSPAFPDFHNNPYGNEESHVPVRSGRRK